MIYITHVHMSSANSGYHEHIAEVRWQDSSDGKTGSTSTAGMVKFIDEGNKVSVRGANGDVPVGVVNGNPKYIRTYANGAWTDNLLSLPRY